jgi:lipopolysaccharide export system protein LptA
MQLFWSPVVIVQQIRTIMTLIGGVFVLCQIGYAQDTERTPLVIRSADQMVGYETELGPVRELQGNVQLQHGTVEIRCDRARQYLSVGQAELIGNVVITQGALRMSMDRGEYLSAERVARGWGNVVIADTSATLRAPQGRYYLNRQQAIFHHGVELRDRSTTVTSDSLMYDRQTGERRGWGHVRIEFHTERMRASGDSAYQYPADGRAWVCGRSMLVQWDSVATDTLYLRADCLHLGRDRMNRRTLKGDGRVILVRGAMSARADSAVFVGDSCIMLEGQQPVVWADSAQLRSQARIIAILHNRQLERIVASQRAMLGLVEDSASAAPHQLMADSITLKFEQDSLKSVYGDGNAQTLYQHRTDTGAPDGVTQVASDRVELRFEQGKIVRSSWYGGINSQYIPEHLVGPAERYLPGFRWNTESKPTQHELLQMSTVSSTGGAP